jgi:hypothetical protein
MWQRIVKMGTPRGRKSTIYDIGLAADTSPTTVSLVLGGSWRRYRIKQETATRILECAERLGYAVNLKARGLRLSRSGLADCVSALGRVSRMRSLALMRGADVNVLLQTIESGTDVIAGKAFDYLAARRPILGIVDPQIAPSDHYLEVWEHYGMTADAIVARLENRHPA